MKIKSFLAILLLSMLFGFLQAQESMEQKITRLEAQLSSDADEKKIDTLIQLGRYYHLTDPKKCLEYGNSALELSTKLNLPVKQAGAFKCIGVGYMQLGEPEKALGFFEKSMAVYEAVGDIKNRAGMLGNLGIIYRTLGDMSRAVECYEEAIETFERIGSKRSVAIFSSNLGNVYNQQGDFQKALEFYLKALTVHTEIDNKTGITNTCNNIGSLFIWTKQYEKALEYLRRATAVSRETGEKEGLMIALNNIGVIYMDKMKDYPKALRHFQECLKMSQEMGEKSAIAQFMGNVGNVYQRLGDFTQALRYHRRALDINEEAGDQFGRVNSLQEVAVDYLNLQDDEKALDFLERALKIAESLRAKNHLKNIYHHLGILHEKKGRYQKALQYLRLYIDINNQLFNETSSKQMAELQTRYDSLKNQKEIDVLKQNNKILEKDNQLQRVSRNLFIVGFILVLLIVVLLVNKGRHWLAFWKQQKYIGHYRLGEQIGYGGMATVYKAFSIRDKSDVAAVKIIRAEYCDDEKYRKRFKSEGNIIDQLSHPHIVGVKERGESNGKLFIAMEYLEGTTLRDWMDLEDKAPMPACYHIMDQLAETLAFIHDRGFLHRDLKPDNIMLLHEQGDRHYIKLLDFGLARGKYQSRITEAGAMVGTFGYMSPEQLSGAEFTAPADIFSCGIIFYELVTGVTAFPGDRATDVLTRILEETPVYPRRLRQDIPGDLNALVMRMISKKPSVRPTAAAVLDQIRRLRAEEPGPSG